MDFSIVKKAFKITVPVLLGYISIGIPFGLLVVSQGYGWYIAVLMSVFMYTGAGQFFAIGLFASGASVFTNLIVQFFLGIRHFFYGLSLVQKYKNTGKLKPYLIFSITDETYALVSTLNVPEHENKELLYFYISILDQLYWILGTLIGAVACSVLQKYNLAQYLEGIDFSLTALFITLLIGQIKNGGDKIAALSGGLTSVAAIVLYRFGILRESNIIWVSICIGMGIMAFVRGPSFFREEENAAL